MQATVTRQSPSAIDGRRERKLKAMRRVQGAALALFERRGFDAVTIEEIARAAEVSAPTVYRGFGTKEQLVLWDEYDPMLLEAVEARLPSRSLRKSVLEALIACLAEIYASDRARILRRAKLIVSQPALLAASSAQLAHLERALASAFLGGRACKSAFEAEVKAGAIVAALACAVNHWVRQNGRAPLGRLLQQAFGHLSSF